MTIIHQSFPLSFEFRYCLRKCSCVSVLLGWELSKFQRGVQRLQETKNFTFENSVLFRLHGSKIDKKPSSLGFYVCLYFFLERGVLVQHCLNNLPPEFPQCSLQRPLQALLFNGFRRLSGGNLISQAPGFSPSKSIIPSCRSKKSTPFLVDSVNLFSIFIDSNKKVSFNQKSKVFS